MKDTDENKSEENQTLHLKWKSHTTYTIAMLSWTVGLTNIFHTPFFIMKIGFWNFLASHVMIMVIVGIPLTVVEIAISQYSSKSLVRCWDFCPLFRGAGYAKIILLTLCQVYYNVLNSYLLFYCFTSIPKYHNLSQSENASTIIGSNISLKGDAEKFWYSEVIAINTPVDYLGDPNWKLIYYLLGHMILVLLFNLNGVESLELVLPFTFGLSLLQYGILLCLVNTVPGAWDGIKDIFSTRFDVNSILIWKKEAILSIVFQNYLYSMGLNFGGFSSIAAQGLFRLPVYRTAIWSNLINLVTSICHAVLFANFFGIINYYSRNDIKKIHIDNIDFYNIFTVIPNGLNYLPGFSQGWKFVFYSSIYLRGLCSTALMTSTILSALYEVRPKLSNCIKTCSLTLCLMTYFTGCLLHTNYGPRTGNMLRYVTGSIILPTITSLQVISVVLVYGLQRFTEDLHFMTGYAPPAFWTVCLIITVFVVPFLTFQILIQYFSNVVLSSYEMVLQKIIVIIILAWIPFMSMVRIIQKKRWKLILGSSTDWILPDGLEKSRQLFKEHNCVDEFVYEKHVIEDKIKKYE